jgi:hypothetical protein
VVDSAVVVGASVVVVVFATVVGAVVSTVVAGAALPLLQAAKINVVIKMDDVVIRFTILLVVLRAPGEGCESDMRTKLPHVRALAHAPHWLLDSQTVRHQL